jgi:hypothetical protein
MENLSKLEERRLALYENYKKENKKGILFALGGGLIILVGVLATLPIFFFLGAIPLIVGFVFFAKAGKHLTTFKAMFKNELILTLLKEQFIEPVYSQHDMISVPRILSTGMVKKPDRHSGEDYMRGSYKGVQFEVSDIDLKERVETRDSKGNVQVSYQTYFKGRWYVYTFERMFKEVLKIQEGRGFGMGSKGLVKIDTESIEFNKKFSILASTQEYGFYHITSSMIEKLLELEKMHRGTILYCYMNNELHIGVNDRRDYMELSIKTPINKESLKDFQADIDLIPAIINELRLDSSKFKKN